MSTDNFNLFTPNSSSVNVTGDRVAHPKYWIATLVKVCTERKVGEKLTKLNIHNWVPTQSEIHQWSDRKKQVLRVVIPMVVFAKVDEIEEKQLKNLSFIKKILTYPGQKSAAIIPEEQIERLKFMLSNAESQVELDNNQLQIGEQVRIVRGSLKGLEGELHIIDSEKMVVAIRVECLGCACVRVSSADIERI